MRQLLFGLLMLMAMTGVSAATVRFEFNAAEHRPIYYNDFFGQIDPGELLLGITVEAEPPVGLPDAGPDRFVVQFFDENRFPGNPYGRITSLTAYNWGSDPSHQYDSVEAIFNPTAPQTGPDTIYERFFDDYRACNPYPTCPFGTDNSVDAGSLYVVDFLMPNHREPPHPGHQLLPYDLVSRGIYVSPGQDAISLSNFHNSSGIINGDWTYSVVPIPAGVWLFGTALIGLVGFSKRRKAA
jgi:hypothetical protein